MNTSFYNYWRIFHLGDQIGLNIRLDNVDLKQYNDKWFKYNPRKDIKRDGLSVINDTGKLIPGPDLDSLPQYNAENGTSLCEDDFKMPTDVFYEKNLFKILDPIKHILRRTHFLKIPPGGYFPPHRDEAIRDESRTLSFRLIIPYKNIRYPNIQFMVDDKFIHLNERQMYVINTFKSHSLVNMSSEDSYWLVCNAVVCDDAVDFVHANMSVR